MRKLFIVAFCAAICACSNKKSANNETGTRKNADTTAAPAPPQPVQENPEKKPLVLDGVEYPGNVANAVFQDNGKTLFYYNVDTKKGAVSINGQPYHFDFFSHVVNTPDFTLKAGSEVQIRVEGTKYADYENPEPGIMKGRAALVQVIRGTDTLTLKNTVQVIDGTNAD